MVKVDALIDTSIIVDLIRYYPVAANWLTSRNQEIIAVTLHVWLEVVSGAENKSLAESVMAHLKKYAMIYPERADMDWAMKMFSRYYLSHSVGFVDCLIAAPASRLNIPLYTTNLKHFTPILGALAMRPY